MMDGLIRNFLGDAGGGFVLIVVRMTVGGDERMVGDGVLDFVGDVGASGLERRWLGDIDVSGLRCRCFGDVVKVSRLRYRWFGDFNGGDLSFGGEVRGDERGLHFGVKI